MSDLGPRRMDGFARPNRPAGAAGSQPKPVRPQPVRAAPTGQPTSVQQNARPAATQPAQRPVQPAGAGGQAAPVAASPPPKRRSGWRVLVQFVIGLAVIVGVAVAIVALYVKYYTQ